MADPRGLGLPIHLANLSFWLDLLAGFADSHGLADFLSTWLPCLLGYPVSLAYLL